jgi:Phage protein Gp138 N-terminal domain
MDRRELLQDPEEAARLSIESETLKYWSAVPGIIESVNYDEQTVSVQPAIQGVLLQTEADGTQIFTDVTLPLLVDVPLMFPCGGGFALTLPVQVGDECLVILSTKCIDGWWQSGNVSPQLDFRVNDLSDGFCMLAPKSLPNTIPSISPDTAQFRTLDGNTYVEITSNKINVVSASDVNITATGNTNITASGDLNVNAENMTLTAAANLALVASNITANGTPI